MAARVALTSRQARVMAIRRSNVGRIQFLIGFSCAHRTG
jgi:hypothetical protein